MNETEKNSVLIVDDEELSIMTLTHILSPEYTVYVAKNGLDAIQMVERYLPDVILLDIIMPKMDGYAIIAELKNSKKTQNIPVIFISGLANTGDEEKGLALGASDYINKPFNAAIVKLRVQNQVKIINQTRLIIEKELFEKSIRVKREFLTHINCEILMPINTILDMLRMARTSGDSDETKEYLYEIESASHYLRRLIGNLFDISSGDAFNLSDTVFSFKAMLQEILKDIRHETAKKQQTLNFEIDPLIPEPLIGDEKRLARAIINLLINAQKYTQEHGKIHLRAYVLNESEHLITLLIEVIDNGAGIPKEQQSDIFNIFNQASAGSPGIGLGLYVSRRIIEEMGGKIWVDSEPGRGSKFAFICNMQKR